LSTYDAQIRIGVTGQQQIDALTKKLNAAQQQIERLSKGIQLRLTGGRSLDAIEQRLRRLGSAVLRPRLSLDTSGVERQLRALEQPAVKRVRVVVEGNTAALGGAQQRALPPAGGGTGVGAIVAGTALGRVMAGGKDMAEQVKVLAAALNANTPALGSRTTALPGGRRIVPPVIDTFELNGVWTPMRNAPQSGGGFYAGPGRAPVYGSGGLPPRPPGGGSTLPSANLPDPGESFDKGKRAAGGFGSELLKLSAAYLTVDTAVRQVQQTLQNTFDRAGSETRIKALAQGLDDYQLVLATARQAGDRFNLSTNESLDQFSKLYGRLRPLGLTLEEVTTVYEGFNTATRLSGTTAAEAANTLTQLAQGLGSGTLRGDELRSVLEQVPAVAQAIARELGVLPGQIKKFAEEGKITSEVVVRALGRIRTEGTDKLAESFNTPEQRLKQFTNAWEDLQVAAGRGALPAIIATLDRAAKYTEALAKQVARLSKGFDAIAQSSVGQFISGIGIVFGALNKELQITSAWLNAIKDNPLLAGGPVLGGIGALINGAAGLSPRRGRGAVANPLDLSLPPGAWPAGIPRPGTTGPADTRTLGERLGTAAGKAAGEEVKRVIGGSTGGGQLDASRGRSTGPHLHAQGSGDLQRMVDQALDFGGGRRASSYGISRGAAGHGYPAIDYLTPQASGFTLRPGYTGTDLGIRGALGRGMRVSGPGGSFELGHLADVRTGKGSDLLGAQQDALNQAVEEAARAAEDARKKRLEGLDQEEQRVRLLADLAKSRAGSELERLAVERKLENDLLFVAQKRSELEANPNLKIEAAARQADIASRQKQVLEEIAALAQPVTDLQVRVQELFRTGTESPLQTETTAVRDAFAGVNAEVDALLKQLAGLGGGTPAIEELQKRLTALKSTVAGGSPAGIATDRLTSGLQQGLQGDADRLRAEQGAIRQGRPLNRQEELSLDPTYRSLPQAQQQRLTEQAKVNDGLDRQNQLLTDQVQLVQSVGQAMAQGIGSAIQGLITGTQTLNDVLAQTLSQIGQLLINSAINRALGGISIGGIPLLGARAGGGPVRPDGAYLVGEQGPELFVPKVGGMVLPSGMTTALQEGAIPNNSRAAASNEARAALTRSHAEGNTKIDFTGPTLMFEGERYIKAEQAPALIAQATKQAEARILANHRNKPGYLR
jgi:tape measure domain-containing protein